MVASRTTRIAGSIDAYREQRGISLDDLAAATGIPRTTLARKIRNGGLFTIDELDAVSAALEVPTSSWLVAS